MSSSTSVAPSSGGMAPAPKPERHIASHVFNIVVMSVGVLALAFMLHKLGLSTVRRVLRGVGGWFGVIIALDLAAVCCDAAALHQFMRPEARMIKYWRVLAAQLSGRAINILTPGGALGEATKISMLVAHAPRGRVVSSIVLLNLAQFYLAVAIVIIGVPVTALLVDLPHSLKLTVWIGLGVVVVVVVGIGVMIQRGALETILAGAGKTRILSAERVARWTGKVAEIDRHVKELQSDQSPGTRAALALLVASRLCTWSAATVVLYSVGVELGFTLLCGVFSVGVLIGWISAIIPFGMGVADGGNYALFDVLGASGAHGVFVTLLGRARSLTLALLGLLVMATGHTANRLEIARRARLVARLAAERRAESVARNAESGA